MPCAGHASAEAAASGCGSAAGGGANVAVLGGGATRSTWPGITMSVGAMWFQLAISSVRWPNADAMLASVSPEFTR